MSEKERLFTDYVASMASQIATNYVQIASVLEILVDKGLLTKEEVDKKFDEIWDDRSKKVFDYFETGDSE